MKTSGFIFLALLLTVSFAVGCSNKEASDTEFVRQANDTNIKKLMTAYSLYASRFGYTGPKSKEELVDFIKTNDSIEKNLDRIGLDRNAFDQVFVSENDGEEFTVRWGVFVNPDRQRAKEPIIFEKTGAGGTRMVMISNKNIIKVSDDSKYEKLLKGKVKKEDTMTAKQLEAERSGEDF